jgi:hypothetical protein
MVLLAACGGGDAPGPVADFDTRVRACAIIGACIGYGATPCIALLDANATAAQITCALNATVADCAAVRACFGQRITQDPACTSGCSDGDTLVRCSGGQRVEQDCGSALESVGPACITNGRSDCGGASCTDNGRSCNGTLAVTCDSGVTEEFDCTPLGLECNPTADAAACRGRSTSKACTFGTPPTCDGDTLVSCDGQVREQDCRVFGGRKCIAGACTFGVECDGGLASTCNGTVLEMCVGGLRRSIDCTTIGGTTCMIDRCR